MNTTKQKTIANALGIGVALLAPYPAHAIDVQQIGANACTGNLPIDDAALRKRTSGIFNGSSSTVYVTCSLPTVAMHVPPNDSQRFERIQLQISNPSSRYVTVRCKLALTISPIDTVYQQTSLTLAPNRWGFVTFNPPASRFSNNTFAVGCALPGHVEIKRVLARLSEFEFVPME